MKISYYLSNGLPLDSGLEVNKFTIQCNDSGDFSIKVILDDELILSSLLEEQKKSSESIKAHIEAETTNCDLWLFFNDKYIVIPSIPIEYSNNKSQIYVDIYSADDTYKTSILARF